MTDTASGHLCQAARSSGDACAVLADSAAPDCDQQSSAGCATARLHCGIIGFVGLATLHCTGRYSSGLAHAQRQQAHLYAHVGAASGADGPDDRCAGRRLNLEYLADHCSIGKIWCSPLLCVLCMQRDACPPPPPPPVNRMICVNFLLCCTGTAQLVCAATVLIAFGAVQGGNAGEQLLAGSACAAAFLRRTGACSSALASVALHRVSLCLQS